MNRSVRKTLSQMRMVKSNNFRKLLPSEIKVGFDEVFGHTECKKDLDILFQFLEKPEHFLQYQIVPYCKYLLVGPEGAGKATLACSVAKKANLPIYVVEPSFFYDTDGVLEQLDLLFEGVKTTWNGNCDRMILFKEIEYISTLPEEIAHQILEKLLGYFRDFPKLVAFATISATTQVEISKSLVIPPAFSKTIELSFPELKVREAILKFLLKNFPVEEGVEISRLAQETYQMAFGDIKSIVKDSILLCLRNQQKSLTYDNFAEALAQSNFGYAKGKLNYEERLATARHEAGHVIAGYYSAPGTYKLSKVEITPRSSYSGITQKTLDEEKVGYFKEELEAEIISAFGGMASEKFYYNSTTTGVANDLECATELAIEIFKRFGMSEKVGPICLDIENEAFSSLNDSADEAIREFLRDMYERAQRLMQQYSEPLEELTNELLKKEVLYSDEVMEILTKYNK